jgi:hypothetical protein
MSSDKEVRDRKNSPLRGIAICTLVPAGCILLLGALANVLSAPMMLSCVLATFILSIGIIIYTTLKFTE